MNRRRIASGECCTVSSASSPVIRIHSKCAGQVGTPEVERSARPRIGAGRLASCLPLRGMVRLPQPAAAEDDGTTMVTRRRASFRRMDVRFVEGSVYRGKQRWIVGVLTGLPTAPAATAPTGGRPGCPCRLRPPARHMYGVLQGATSISPIRNGSPSSAVAVVQQLVDEALAAPRRDAPAGIPAPPAGPGGP